MTQILGTTAMSSIAAAILNGGTKEQSPWREYPDFEQTWDELAAELAGYPPGTEIEFPFDIDDDRTPPSMTASAPEPPPFGGPGSGRYPKGSGKDPKGGPAKSPAKKADPGRAGVEGRTAVDAGFRATPEQLSSARDVAKAKFDKLPEPTDADRAEAKARHARNKRHGGDDRPSAAARRKRKQQLVDEFGDGKTCPCVNCGQMLTPALVSMDRIIPGSDNGRYNIENLVPMDYDCNRARSNSSFTEMMGEW